MKETKQQDPKGQKNYFFMLFIAFDVVAVVIIVILFARAFSGKASEQSVSVTYKQNVLADNTALMKTVDTMISDGLKEKNQERFKNSVFLGDSLTEGLGLYGYVKTKNVVAKRGLSLEQARKRINKIAKKKPKYVFIMLGINDLEYSIYTLDDIEANYKKLIVQLHNKIPDTKIYVQSLLPVTAKFEKSHKRMSNKRIVKLNNRIKKLVSQYDYATYVDVHHLYANSKGKLSGKLSSDGYHLYSDAYQPWVKYVKNEMKE